jgi:hypothetical protein
MRRSMRAALAIVIGAGISVVGAAPAHAAQGNLEVSPDGVSYSKTFHGALFDDIDFVVPGDVQDKKLFLRNSGDAPGFLRVVLEDVVYTDPYFASALTLQAAVAGASGPRTPINLAEPCWVLTEGQRVAPGEVVALDTQLLLGNLDGQQGMGASAHFSMAITLSDTAPGSLPPTECGQPDLSVPLVPRAARGGETAQATNPTVTPTGRVESTGDGELPVLNLPGGVVIDPNTWNLLEELFVLLLVVSFLGGGAWFMITARRRTADPSDEMEGVA